MKEKLKKIYQRMKEPSLSIMLVAYVLTAVFITGALLMLFVDYVGTALEVLAYTLFGLAGVSLAYTVYTVVRFAPSIKARVLRAIERNRITRTLKNDYIIRTVAAASFAFFMSIAFAVFNGVLGILYLSIWYGALAAYHIMICLVRGRTVLTHIKTVGAEDGEAAKMVRAKNYRNSGIIMLILNIALSSAIAQMIFDDRFFNYPDLTVFAYAAYAFYKITMSIINIFKSRKQDYFTVHALRDINLIDACVSILALQTALLHTFTDGTVDVSLFNTLTGIAVSLSAITLSVFMIRKGNRSIREMRTEK